MIARPLPDGVVDELRRATARVLDEGLRDPLVKKVHDSYFAYLGRYAKWSALSEGVYHAKIRPQG